VTDELDWSDWMAAKSAAEVAEWRSAHPRAMILRAVDGSDDALLREQGVPEGCWPKARGEPGYCEGDPPDIIIRRIEPTPAAPL
jgi:hypothetical protein